MPQEFVATEPRVYDYNGDNNVGIGGPSNIVHNSRDGFHYALFNIGSCFEQVPAQGFPAGATSVMRTLDLSDPAAWRGWGGPTAYGGSGGFTVPFVDPYTASGFSVDDHIPWPIAFCNIGQMHESVTYNRYLECFVLIGITVPPGAEALAISYSFSSDLVNWTTAKLLHPSLQWPTETGPGQYVIFYPSLIDHESDRPSFDSAGKTAHVYFTDHKDQGGQIDRDLVCIEVEFFKP